MNKIKVDEVEMSESVFGVQVDAYKDGERIAGGILANEIQAMLYIKNEFELPDESE